MKILIFLIPIIDSLIMTFLQQYYQQYYQYNYLLNTENIIILPSITILITLWKFCKNIEIIKYTILQSLYLSLAQINLSQIMMIIFLNILAIYSKNNFKSPLVAYLFLSLTYWFTLILNYNFNWQSGLILLLIFMIIWYNEKRGKLDNRFA